MLKFAQPLGFIVVATAVLVAASCSPVPRCTTDEECVARNGGRSAYCHMRLRYCFDISFDSGVDASVAEAGDAGRTDSGVNDSGAPTDSGVKDAGEDAGPADSGSADGGLRDAGVADGGRRADEDGGDSGVVDAGCPSCDPLIANNCMGGSCHCGSTASCAVGSFCVVGTCRARWATTGSLSSSRNQASSTLLQDGRVLVAGGSTNSNPTNTAEIYSP